MQTFQTELKNFEINKTKKREPDVWLQKTIFSATFMDSVYFHHFHLFE
jgi:hypothetical protein